MSSKPIVLASGSISRKAMLTAAQVPFTAMVPDVDETAVKAAMTRATPSAIAAALAEKKALAVAAPAGVLVIGSDQILECGAEMFSKVESLAAARNILRRLRGRTHRLITSVVLVCDKSLLWRHCETVSLVMRDFSDAFLDAYLAAEGEALLSSVGCYRLEGLGAQLFEAIDGDHFSVRGLPLLPLLAALRQHGGLPA
jgi:septum formation protein